MNKDQTVIEIDLADMLKKMLKSWKLILVCMLAFGIAFPAIRWKRNVNAYRAAKAETEKALQSEEGLLGQLSDDEKSQVEQCRNYYNRIAQAENYLSESALMQVDPYHAPEVTLQFVLSGTDHMRQIKEAYTSYINGKGFLNDLAKATGWEEDPTYLAELVQTVSSDAEGRNDSTSVNLIVPDPSEENGTKEEQADYENLTVKVTGRDADEAEKIADALAGNLEAYQAEAAASYGDHSVTLADSSTATVVDGDLLDEIRTINDKLYNNQNALNNLENSLTDDQKQVWESIRDGINEEVEEETVSASPSAAAAEEANDSKADGDDTVPGVSKKDIAIGLVLGLVIAIFLLALRYVLSGKVHTVDEVRTIYKKPVLGTFTKRELWTAEKEILLATVRLACKNDGISRLVLATSLAFTGEEKKLVDQVREELGRELELSYSELVLESPEAIREMGDTGAVIFWEKLESTKRNKAYAEARLCRELGIKCVGTVIFS